MITAHRMDPSRVASGSVIVEVKFSNGWVPKCMTTKGFALLASLGDGRHVRGGEVAIARKLEADGLVTLTDDGAGPASKERWSAEPTDIGRLVRDAKVGPAVMDPAPAPPVEDGPFAMTKDKIIERLQSATTFLVEVQHKLDSGASFSEVNEDLDYAEDDIRAARAALALNEHRETQAKR